MTSPESPAALVDLSMVTRFGHPVAEISAPGMGLKPVRKLGTMAGTMKIVGDIVGPIGDESDWGGRMKLLLDTHIWIWSVQEPCKLTSEVAREIAQQENALFLSPVSIWELRMLTERKRVVLNMDFGQWCKNR